jgi:ABC-2 type transport system ATP-binding protein
MRVLDQLVYYASLYGEPEARARAAALSWLERFRITEYSDRRAEELSKGNQQKVQFIAAILHRPDVMLMDEPFTGLDPLNLLLLREAFTELRDEGRTIIFSTHQLEAAEAMCQSVAIVDRGRLVAGGRIRDLKRASGRQWVRLTMEGPETAPAWLADLPGVQAVRRGASIAELELRPDMAPAAILAGILDRGHTVSRFEVAEPSLEALFIELVGRPADDDLGRAVAPPSGPGPARAKPASAGDLA